MFFFFNLITSKMIDPIISVICICSPALLPAAELKHWGLIFPLNPTIRLGGGKHTRRWLRARGDSPLCDITKFQFVDLLYGGGS